MLSIHRFVSCILLLTKHHDFARRWASSSSSSRSTSSTTRSTRTSSNNEFEAQLDNTSFRIFEFREDFGFYKWTPSTQINRTLEEVQLNEEFLRMIDPNGMPNHCVEPTSLSMPIQFSSFETSLTTPQQIHKCCYPYGQDDFAGLFVAKYHRGIDFENIDFVFGGRTLNMLATQTPFDDYYKRDQRLSYYYATVIPGTKSILVTRRKTYEQDYQSRSFQFERIMTGKTVNEPHKVESTYHLQTMTIGGRHRVLFNAEADALYANHPIEIKMNKQKYWGSQVFFQMVSCGSPYFCHGLVGKSGVEGVDIKPLSKVAKIMYSGIGPPKKREPSIHVMEERILKYMDSLKSLMVQAKEGQIFRIHFCPNGDLKLIKIIGKTDPCLTMLPPEATVRELTVANATINSRMNHIQ